MDSDALIVQAEQEQRDAYTLLDALDLMDHLRQIGTPVLVGSIRTGLMHYSDIDVVVHVDQLTVEPCFEVLCDVARHEDIVKVVFFENKRLKRLGGFFIDIGCHFRKRDWPIHIVVWDVTVPYARISEATTLATLRALDDRTRRTILRIKAERRRRFGHMAGDDTRGGLGAIAIYRAVLDGHVTTYEAAVAWLTAHPLADEFVDWQPRPR
jgi:hypothetical protein